MSKQNFAFNIKYVYILLLLSSFNFSISAQSQFLYQLCREKNITTDFALISASDNESALIFSNTNTISALDYKNFEKLWTVDLAGTIISNLILSGNFLYLVTETEVSRSNQIDSLWVVNKFSGVVNKRITLPEIDNKYLLKINRNLYIFSKLGSIQMISLDHDPAEIDDVTNLKTVILDPLLHDSDVIFNTGRTLDSYKVIGKSFNRIFENQNDVSTYLIENDLNSLLIGDEKGWFIAVSTLNFRVKWKYQTGGRIINILSCKNKFYAFSKDNFIYCFSQLKGKLIWKKRFEDIEDLRALVLDDQILLKSIKRSELFFLDSNNGKIIKQLSNPETGSQTNSQLLKISSDSFLIINSDKVFSYSSKSCDK